MLKRAFLQWTVAQLVFGLLFGLAANAAPVSEQTAQRVAINFVANHVALHGSWNGVVAPEVASIELVTFKNLPLAYNVTVRPSGHLLVAYSDDFSPVILYSDRSAFIPSRVVETDSVESWILPETHAVAENFRVRHSEMLSDDGVVSVGMDKASSPSFKAWQFYDQDPASFVAMTRDVAGKTGLLKDGPIVGAVGGPLLTTSWNQGDPRTAPFTYNLYTPADSGCSRTYTGCVATAVAQVMKYWNWPTTGTGSKSYTWKPPSGAAWQTLTANFNRSYAWSSMPASLSTSTPSSQIQAVAQLMADLGVAFEMGYGCSGSGAWMGHMKTALPNYFGYRNSISEVSRSAVGSASAFFAAIKAEIDASPPRPVLLSIFTPSASSGHAVVADGYQTGATDQVHINMGWGGSYTGYYDISGNWTTGSNTWSALSTGGAYSHTAYVNISPTNTVTCSYSIGSAGTSLSAGAQSGFVSLTAGSTCAWTASSNASWLSVVSAASGTGSATVSFSVASNASSGSRTGTLTVGGQSYNVVQAGAGCSYSVSPTTISLASASATTAVVNVTTGSSCSWTSAGNGSWLTVLSGTTGTGSGSASISVAANPLDSTRSSGITVAGQSVNVTQSGGCAYVISPSSQSLGATGSTGSVNVTAAASCAWTASSNAAWIAVSYGATGAGYGTVGYSVSPNTSTSSRTGTLTIARQTFTVTQAGITTASTSLLNPGFENGQVNWTETAPYPLISNNPARAKTGYWFAWLGGYDSGTDRLSQDVAIPSTAQQTFLQFAYNIETAETAATPYDVLQLELYDPATGAKIATLASLSNMNATVGWVQSARFDLSAYRGRTVRITFTATLDVSNFTSFLIDDVSMSSVSACTYFLSPSSISVGGGASNGTVNVGTSPADGCPWTATSTVNWISTSSVGNGTGNATFSIATNTTGASRTGTITIVGQTFGVTQAAQNNATANLLINGGFENGVTGWTEVSTANYPIITTDNAFVPNGGVGYAWLSGYNAGTDTLFQDVTIPANTQLAYLQFWYRILSSEPGTTANDTFAVELYNPGTGARLATLLNYSNLNVTTGWVQSQQFDISAYKGQAIRISFKGITDAANATSFLLDDVVLIAATPGSGSQDQSITFALAPSGRVGGTVFLTGTSSSGLAVTYSVATPAVCSVSGQTLSLIAVGTCSVTASQAGNGDFRPAAAVSRSIQVVVVAVPPLSMRGGIDLDGNNKSAILVRTSTPQLYAGRWANNQFQFTQMTDPGASFRIAGVADFDGNGRSDLAYQNMTQGTFGDVRTWPDFNQANSTYWRQVKQVWDVQAVGDLDGDGYGDLVWRYVVNESADTGVSYIWFTNGSGVTQVRKRGGAPLSWKLVGAADLNGDGAADMIYISPDRQIRVLMATANRTCANFSSGVIVNGFTALKLADFTGRRSGDILSRNAGTGQVTITSLDAAGAVLPPPSANPDDPNASCTASTATVAATTYFWATSDASWQLYATGDFNGDGLTDIAWLRPDGKLTVWLMNVSGTVPVAPTVIDNAGTPPAGGSVVQP